MASTTQVDGWVFPEDSGTNTEIALGEGDWSDSGNFASYAYGIGLHDYVVGGLELTVNYSNQTFELSQGAAVISVGDVNTVDHTGGGGRGSELRDEGASFIIHTDTIDGLPLDPSGLHHVFLSADRTTDDAISVHVDTNPEPPSETSLRIAEVDMDTNSVNLLNRYPELVTADPTEDNDCATKRYVDREVAQSESTYGTTAVRSGDDSTRTFSFSHPLGTTPSGVSVTPASSEASADFWVESKDAAEIQIKYDAAPPTGVNNLRYDITAIL